VKALGIGLRGYRLLKSAQHRGVPGHWGGVTVTRSQITARLERHCCLAVPLRQPA